MTEIDSQNNACPLCASCGPYTNITGPKGRGYLLCENCQLIFMQREFLPDRTAEKERYQAHQNGPQDAGYVQFLNQAITPALRYLNASMRGLDYGCGPVPTLSGLLKEHGLHCENYDPYFCPAFPEGSFDFIFATEVVEHFFHPAQELQRISALLQPGGMLTIMTEPWVSLAGFSEWHYAKDMTHVCFYHANTIAYICTRYGFEKLNQDSPRVSVLKQSIPFTG
jgi:SAM-dependent methyltransferase